MLPPRISPRSLLSLLIVTATVAIAACSSSSAQPSSAQPALTVRGAITGPAIPSGFVGLSMEYKALAAFAGTNPRAVDPAFLQLVQDISPDQQPVLRIGGDSTDWTWWPIAGAHRPGGVTFTLTRAYLSVAHAVANALSAHLILGVNLEADSPRVASAEAQAIVTRIGRPDLAALEIGNEPELYSRFTWYHTPSGAGVFGRPADYDPADFRQDFANIVRVMPDVPLAGPGSGAPTWLADLGAFLRSESRVSLTTIHAYPLKHCSPSTVVTIPELLANSSSYNFAQDAVGPYVRVAEANGKQIRVDEMNAITCGGTQGVSNSFASALWMVDTLFEMTRTGVDGVNVHTVPGSINEILGPSHAHGKWSVRVHPEYYGMIMFAQAAPPGSHLLTLSTGSPSGVHTWATKAPDGDVRVVIINDRSHQPVTMRMRIASVSGAGTLERLRAPSLGALQGVTLGGMSFGAATTTGRLGGTQALDSVRPQNGTYTVPVPAGSAALLSLSPTGAPVVPAGLR